MKFYVAGRWNTRDRLCVFKNKLEDLGHESTAHWLTTDGEDESVTRWAEYAERDVNDIYEAREGAFILFTEHKPPQRNSRLVELGLAIAYGVKLIIIIGPPETVFCSLADERFDTEQECLDYIGAA